MSTLLSDTIGVTVKDVNKTVGNEYARVTKINTNMTVNLKPESDNPESDDLVNIPVLINLALEKDDKVLISHLDNNPNYPVVIGMQNPKTVSGGADGRGIISIDKVETDEFVDIYRITYDKIPIYSYFQVPNADKLVGLANLLISKGILTQEEVNNL
jgi:hypothetical protein